MIFVDARTGRPIATLQTRHVSAAAIVLLTATVGIEATAIVIAHTIEISAETSPKIGIANGPATANGLVIDRHSLIVDRSQDLNVGVLLGIVLALPIASKIAYPNERPLDPDTYRQYKEAKAQAYADVRARFSLPPRPSARVNSAEKVNKAQSGVVNTPTSSPPIPETVYRALRAATSKSPPPIYDQTCDSDKYDDFSD